MARAGEGPRGLAGVGNRRGAVAPAPRPAAPGAAPADAFVLSWLQVSTCAHGVLCRGPEGVRAVQAFVGLLVLGPLGSGPALPPHPFLSAPFCTLLNSVQVITCTHGMSFRVFEGCEGPWGLFLARGSGGPRLRRALLTLAWRQRTIFSAGFNEDISDFVAMNMYKGLDGKRFLAAVNRMPENLLMEVPIPLCYRRRLGPIPCVSLESLFFSKASRPCGAIGCF